MFYLFFIITICPHILAIGLENLNTEKERKGVAVLALDLRNRTIEKESKIGAGVKGFAKGGVKDFAKGSLQGMAISGATAAFDALVADKIRNSGPVGAAAMDVLCGIGIAGCEDKEQKILDKLDGMDTKLDDILGSTTEINERTKRIEGTLGQMRSEMSSSFSKLAKLNTRQHAQVFGLLRDTSQRMMAGFANINNNIERLGDELKEILKSILLDAAARNCAKVASDIRTLNEEFQEMNRDLAATTNLDEYLNLKKIWINEKLDTSHWDSTKIRGLMNQLYTCVGIDANENALGLKSFFDAYEEQLTAKGTSPEGVLIAMTKSFEYFADLFIDGNVLLQHTLAFEFRSLGANLLPKVQSRIAIELVKQDEAYAQFWKAIEKYNTNRRWGCGSYVQTHSGYGCNLRSTGVWNNFGCFHLINRVINTNDCNQLQPYAGRYTDMTKFWSPHLTGAAKSTLDGSMGIYYIDATTKNRNCWDIDMGNLGPGRYFNSVRIYRNCWGF